jgi:predicted permease
MNPDLLHARGNRWLAAVARLKPGVTSEQAAASLLAMIKGQQTLRSDENRNLKVDVAPIAKGDPRARSAMIAAATLLTAVVGMVLLIACVNVANLLLARATSRAREIAVRLSLGASRGRLIRQLLTESVLLAGIGGIVGLGLAWVTLNALKASPPPAGAVPLTLDFGIDGRVLAFTLVLSLLTGAVFGLAPALRASRPQLAPTLKDESFVPNERLRSFNLRHALVVVQVATSVVLLVSAGLFLRSLQESRSVQPGFDAERVLTVPLNINLLRYTSVQGRQFYRDAVERVKALPGVEAATVTRWVPLTGGNSVRGLMVQGVDAAENVSRSENAGARAIDRNSTIAQVVGVGYFQTMGIPLRRGRDFSDADAADRPPVAVVNQAFVDQHLKGDPIGQRISTNGAKGPWIEIVGVAANSKLMTVSEPPSGNVYLPVLQNHETGMTLLVRSARDPALLAPSVIREVHALEKNLPVTEARSLAALLDVSLYASRAGTWALGIFGSLALLLASLGLYGVMSYAVARRAKEIGLRMALGARGADVLRQVLREGMLLVILGVVVGLALAAGSTRLLESFLFGVGSRDTLTFIATPLLLGVVGLAACWFPARRATRMDPMSVLRQQ